MLYYHSQAVCQRGAGLTHRRKNGLSEAQDTKKTGNKPRFFQFWFWILPAGGSVQHYALFFKAYFPIFRHNYGNIVLIPYYKLADTCLYTCILASQMH